MTKDILDRLICYKTLPIWTMSTIPEAFKNKHNTKSGTWAKLQILSGSLTIEFLSDEGAIENSIYYDVNHQPDFILPQQYHRIAQASQDVRCQLSFYHLKEEE